MTTEEFITLNAGGDVRRLALQGGRYPGVDMSYALEQIAGRQTAARKLPSWAAVDGIVYPPHLPMEQCSSERTARYKAAVARRLCGAGRFIDITGGFGVDFSFIARGFDSATYVERQERLCAIASANFRLLGLDGAVVVNADGIEYLRHAERAAMIYADPARRDSHGGRVFAISDCTPDVAAARGLLLSKADRVMLKLSPMLDWRKAVADLGGSVSEVHIVSVGNECKELLLVLSDGAAREPAVYCVNDDRVTELTAAGTAGSGAFAVRPLLGELAGGWLYEPDASVMKAGRFALLEERYGVRQIDRDSHLFVSAGTVEGFPGRRFTVDDVTTMNKKELRRALSGVTKANITVRNFPMTVAELRRRLRIADGGGVYIFATTLADRTHALLLCSKA